MMVGALADVRVIDFTHALNGPFCTMLLGHFGAEVIKIEPPGGDSFRRIWMPRDAKVDGYEFLWVNANKKSVVLDLKTARGVELARQLIAKADVLVENFQKGTMQRFGLDYESVRQINPRLVYACSRGFGEWGPYSAYGSTAGNNNGMTGWTQTAWDYSGAPGTRALGIGDEAAGVSMALGILAALHAREQTGEGQKIEVSMQEAVLGFMISRFHEFFTGNRIGVDSIQVADGYFNLRTPDITDSVWRELAQILDDGALADDPRFATSAARREHRRELDELVRDWASGRTRQEVWEALKDLGYFGAPVLSLAEVLEDPHVKERKAFYQHDHVTAGQVTLLAPWIHLSGTPTSIHDDSPAIGQHTDEVLGGVLGLSADELSELRTKGAIA
jgi:crotonobetainyl-CoA:carnitine CoA-transferase CaiB-like acyl-CoA transferase